MFPFPVFETERVAELRATHILDSDPAHEFDDIVMIARDLFGVPICLITLVDADRQWFKARCGLDIDGTEREVAFCNYTILGPDVFTVADAAQDPRFATNALVTGHPHIRFYAGAPLVLGPGIALGGLCLIDTQPRAALDDGEVKILERLARVVTGLIQGHKLSVQKARLTNDIAAQRMLVQNQSRQLQLGERRFEQTERMAGIGGWELTLATRTVAWTDETYRICGVPLGTSIDLDLAASVYLAAERARLHGLIERAVREGIGYDDEFEIVTPAGVHKWIRAVGDVEHLDGVPHRLFGTVQDISERHQTLARLWTAANRDGLTGLPNRNCLDEILSRAFTGSDLPGLLMVDTDRLKEVNDIVGHAAGDALLRTIGDRLRQVIGDRGTVARLSGDEFAVIVNAPASLRKLDMLANEILDAMQAPFGFAGSTLKPQVSVGGAIGASTKTAEIVRQEAGLALCHAKETRRGSYVVFEEDLRAAATARTTAISVVDHAVSCGEIVAWYQPVLDLTNGRVSGLEALARIKRGDAVDSIGAYAEALQDSRTAVQLTARMLERIAADVLAWKAQGIEVPRIALNAGSADFHGGALEAMIMATCDRAEIAPDQFALEVTESVFLSRNADLVSRTTEALRKRGVIIALDDFGTGYASLAHLGTFPVDVMKIDRSFVAQITEAGPRAIISAALIELARKLNIAIVAEGVETAAQLERLLRLGCRNIQGSFFSCPLSADDTAHYLQSFHHKTWAELTIWTSSNQTSPRYPG